MTLRVQNEQAICPKQELARLLSNGTKLPENILKPIFQEKIRQLENAMQRSFNDSLKQRVWEKVSKERLEELNETFVLEIHRKILQDFDDEEVNKILEDYQNLRILQFSSSHSIRLRRVFYLSNSFIVDAISQKANSITHNWSPEIVDVLNKERIE